MGLEVSLGSHRMLEDLLLKARGGSGVYLVTSGFSARRSPFPSVAGLSMCDSVASRSVYSLPTFTETEGNNVVVSGDVLEKSCSSRTADAPLAMGIEDSEKSENDILRTLQQIKSSQKKKKEKKMKKPYACKLSRESRLNTLLPGDDDKGGYVFTEVMLELAAFTKVFATSPEDPLENKYCFYCMLCR